MSSINKLLMLEYRFNSKQLKGTVMKKIFSNPLVIGFILLVIFRIGLLIFVGPMRDGNFLILMIVPFIFFSALASLIKYLLRRSKLLTK